MKIAYVERGSAKKVRLNILLTEDELQEIKDAMRKAEPYEGPKSLSRFARDALKKEILRIDTDCPPVNQIAEG